MEARYYAVSGGATAAYAVKKSLQRNYQYLMMVHNNVAVNVHFVDYDTAINEAMLRRGLDRIDQFDPQNKDTIEQYRSLFATIGSHIITGLNYGDRFQLVRLCSISLRNLPFPLSNILAASLGRQQQPGSQSELRCSCRRRIQWSHIWRQRQGWSER